MTRHFATWVLALATVPAVLLARQEPSFRAATHTVSIYATVVDSTGRLVPDLTKADFEVFDNGQPQSISVFANDIQPITIVIMLDRSGSMVGNFRLVRRRGTFYRTARRQGALEASAIGSNRSSSF
jgi:VWFA-related protein